MVGLWSLWLPILLSSVVVFVVSSIIHMMTPWHKDDYAKAPDEGKLMDALRPMGIPPGDYMIPKPSSRQEASSPEFKDKLKKGPVIMMTVMPSGPVTMWRSMVKWFVYLVVVSVFAAYIASRALPAGAGHPPVLRFAGATAFIGYSLALWQTSIWYGRPWRTTLRITVDGLIYAVLTGLVFGWLWPR